ncbi:ABC transporter substrate-binding protein [Nannocystaceae bacterium ST9]
MTALRSIRLGLSGCALACSVLACSGESLDPGSVATDAVTEVIESDPDERARAEAADPALNEAIVIGLPQLPRKFDPLDDLEPWAQRIADDLVFEGLVRRAGDHYPWVEPAIADRCEVDREYAVAVVFCHVPSGIRFHDGSELTMDDVVYSLGHWVDPRRGWIRQRHGLANLQKVEIVDGPGGGDRDPGRWVKIEFDKREPLALEALTAVKIVPHELHRASPSRFALAPIGTGPMKLTTIDPDRIVAERFAEHHDPARHSASGRLVLRAIADGAQGLTALRRGEIHLLYEVAPVHVPVELGKPGMAGRFRAWLVSPPEWDMLLWNVGVGMQAELPLRRALHDALPLSAIAREVYGAPGLASEAPVDLHEPTPIDLDALADIKQGEPVRGGLLALPSLDDDLRALGGAARALDEQRWLVERGVRQRGTSQLRMTLTWDGQTGRGRSIFERIEQAWQSIGVQVPQASASWTFLISLMRKGEFRVALVHLGGRGDEDLYPLFHSKGATNLAAVDDDELDTALSDYRAAGDRAARDAAKQRIAARLAELRVVSILHAPAHVLLASRRLGELEFVDDMPRLDVLLLSPDAIDWHRDPSGD